MNLIRMNLYRFMKTKCVYILLIITVFLVGFSTLDMMSVESQALIQEMMQQEGLEESSDFTAGITIGMNMITSASMMTGEYIGSGIILVFIAIFVALFSNAERAGGYLKNLNSCAGTKSQIFLAKLVPIIVFVFVILWIIPMVATACGLQGNDIWTKEFYLYMGIQWLIHTAYGIFILTIMEITRSLVAGMLIGIFVGMGFGVTFIQFVENVIIKQEIISRHMLVTMARMVIPDNVTSAIIPALITGMISVTAYSIIGAWTFQKRDIY